MESKWDFFPHVQIFPPAEMALFDIMIYRAMINKQGKGMIKVEKTRKTKELGIF